VLVDVTGSASRIAREMGARRLKLDAMVGIAVVCQAVTPERHHHVVESVPEGWWYSAPWPGNDDPQVVAMLMTDAGPCAAQRLHEAGPVAVGPLAYSRNAGATPA
jgi:hypothetical protein